MDQTAITDSIAAQMRAKFDREPTGHDWWHLHRVRQLANRVLESEGGDPFVVDLAALLHDVADWKFHDGDESVGPAKAREIMEALNVPAPVVFHVCDIVATISYKGAGVATPMKTLEGKIVQDADRLDALGAIGIARAFAYGGHMNRPLFDPEKPPTLHQDKDAYKHDKGTTLNHFHEKLLLLKDRMNTETGKQIAQQRHDFIRQYIEQFLHEWNGTD